MSVNWSRLKITGDTPRPGDWHIYLDGNEIHGVVNVTLSLDVDDVATAHISMMPGSIEVEGAALAELVALVKAKEGAE